MVKLVEVGSSSKQAQQQVWQQEVGSNSRVQDGSSKGQLEWVGGSSNHLLLLLQSSPRTQYLDQPDLKAGWGKDRDGWGRQ